jgi:2-polyprenyl-6-methoxyphenol hydroxylase-like FAD-dependent oxidoreductase
MEDNAIAPVIVVGAGPVGLSCSILMSLRGISHMVFERRTSTSIHPKAAGINQRTTEIFRTMGVEEQVYARAAPPSIAGRTAWYTSLGEGGREIFSRDAWGGGQYRAEYAGFSPSKYCILPQIRLEPVLKQRAEELNPTGISYNSEIINVKNEMDHARVTIRDRATNDVREERAVYVIVADGGRSLTDQLGIRWCGEGGLFDMVTAHIRSPIRRLHPNPTNFITWFTSPEMGGSTKTGYLYQIGPWPDALSDPLLEEWVFACGRALGDPERFNEDSMLQRLRKTIAIPNLPIELLSFSHWTVNALFAERYRIGRIFLAGDSCHKIPPWGALGMNTGIQDVQNLVWKVGLALEDHQKYNALLDTYEQERQDIGVRVGRSSLANMRSHSTCIDKALGVTADQSREENVEAVKAFFDVTHPNHAEKQSAVEEACRQLDTEFKAPGVEVGWFYPSADLDGEGGGTHGGQLDSDGTLIHHTYHESTIPGHHLPHVWVIHATSGQKRALRDLLQLSTLTLFAGTEVKHNVIGTMDGRARVIAIGGPKGWHDPSGKWATLRGVDEAGGVLVRPDGIVAWRGPVEDCNEAQWIQLLDRVLRVNS